MEPNWGRRIPHQAVALAWQQDERQKGTSLISSPSIISDVPFFFPSPFSFPCLGELSVTWQTPSRRRFVNHVRTLVRLRNGNVWSISQFVRQRCKHMGPLIVSASRRRRYLQPLPPMDGIMTLLLHSDSMPWSTAGTKNKPKTIPSRQPADVWITKPISSPERIARTSKLPAVPVTAATTIPSVSNRILALNATA